MDSQSIPVQQAHTLRCYYDADCDFCERSVQRVRWLAGLPEESIIPAQSDPAICSIMEHENSWVVVDHRGNRHLRWRALSVALRRRALLWPVGVFMLAPGIAWLGDRIYRWIANHRGSL